jgi:hypothetical protein
MKIIREHEISNEDVNDLLVCALEGGINYWCAKVEVTKEPKESYEYASEVISLGGELTLTEDEEGTKHVLTQEKFLKGVSKAMEHFLFGTVEYMMDCHDAETADVIIQFAIFDEIVYG